MKKMYKPKKSNVTKLNKLIEEKKLQPLVTDSDPDVKSDAVKSRHPLV